MLITSGIHFILPVLLAMFPLVVKYAALTGKKNKIEVRSQSVKLLLSFMRYLTVYLFNREVVQNDLSFNISKCFYVFHNVSCKLSRSVNKVIFHPQKRLNKTFFFFIKGAKLNPKLNTL